MNVGSLFTGIGGIDLGLERAGMTVRWQSEIDPYCCSVLARHWPDIPNLGDITKIDWSTVEPVDLICGGYPCQPFSLAGTRNGDTDPRHLWPHFANAIRHLRPRYALLENVPGHLSLGFGRVLGDLAELGFDAEWDCIPAAAVGAPHLRYRVFVVAHANREGQSGGAVDAPQAGPVVPDSDGGSLWDEPVSVARIVGATITPDDGCDWDVADTTSSGRRGFQGRTHDGRPPLERSEAIYPLGYGAAALRQHWAIEPDVGRVADGVPHRVDRLRALGNAVVPQVAEYVGRRIMEAAA